MSQARYRFSTAHDEAPRGTVKHGGYLEKPMRYWKLAMELADTAGFEPARP